MDVNGRIVLVLGATGQQGGSVAKPLKANGWTVRALVRDPMGEKATALAGSGIRTMRGDFGNPGSVRAALNGAYGVFSVQPSSGQGAAYRVSDEDEIRYGTGVATLAAEAGIQHFVYSSANAAGPTASGMGHFDTKSAIEDHVRSLGMTNTVIRPSAFMEILLTPGLGLENGRLSFFMRPEQAMQFIAVEDIGKIVARIFADREAFGGRIIEIAGDTVTGDMLAEKFSCAAGRPIAYQRFPHSLLESDRFLGSLAELVDEGRLAGRADVAALRREFNGLLKMDEWLAGPGKAAFASALDSGGELALR